jgi:thiamine biosynthesis lipoprotein
MIEEFEYNGKAMGTEYSIAIVCENRELSYKMYKIGKESIEEYEKKFSRFLPNSELSLLNRKKGMIVSSVFIMVTLKAFQLFNKTKGIFNPLVSVSRLGYDKNFSEIKNNKNIEKDDLYDVDFSSVFIDKNKSYIKLNEGQNLDYGGFLKGYLAELIADKIKSYSPEVKGVIVNIGGDIHTKGLDKNGDRFVFSIYNPILKNEDIVVTLYNQSLATSGTYKRSWLNFSKKIHHILDMSGFQNPENDIISSSIIHKDGSFSEAYTKVFLNVDHKNAIDLLGGDDINFIIIKNNGEIIKSSSI